MKDEGGHPTTLESIRTTHKEEWSLDYFDFLYVLMEICISNTFKNHISFIKLYVLHPQIFPSLL